jgi:hypothetical protein
MHTGGIGQGKETEHLNMVDVLTVREQTVIKLAKPTMGRGLGTNEEVW